MLSDAYGALRAGWREDSIRMALALRGTSCAVSGVPAPSGAASETAQSVSQAILNLEKIAHGNVQRVGPEQRSTGRCQKLAGEPELSAHAHQGARENGVDIRLGRDPLGSAACPSNRRAARVERTVRLSRPERELLMASGRL